jgi:hypothetical protein
MSTTQCKAYIEVQGMWGAFWKTVKFQYIGSNMV